MKLKTLTKIEMAFDVLNVMVILLPFIFGVILGYARDALEWLVDKLDFRLEVGNKLLKMSDEVKNGTIKNKDFIEDGCAKTLYKILSNEQASKTNQK